MKTRTITETLCILLTAVIFAAGLLCPVSLAFAEGEADDGAGLQDAGQSMESVPVKDPEPISADPIYIKSGCRTVQINVVKKYPDLELTYSTRENATVLEVYQNGTVTMLTDKPGLYCVFVENNETEQAAASRIVVPIVIDLLDQKLRGPSSLTAVLGVPVKLKVTAPTPVSYRSDTKSIATVNSKGVVTFKRPGKAIIVATVMNTDIYKGNGKVITITCKLGKPVLKAKAGKRSVKLSWNSVPKTQKYLLYCKYPGKKKYKLVTKRLASVKAVTHKNLKKGRKYSYKLRAYVKLGGKEYFGPYSKAVTVKVK